MLAEVLCKLATVTIFWAADFYDYAEVASKCYKHLQSIQKYSVFSSKGLCNGPCVCFTQR